MEVNSVEPTLFIWMLVSFAILFIWYRTIREIVQSEFQGPNEKLLWLLFVIFVPVLGMCLYLTIGRKSRITEF